MGWAWLAIVLGVLVIATRAPLIFRPTETLTVFRRLVATDGRVRVLGGLYLMLGLACLGTAVETGGGTRQILVFLAVLFSVITVWMIAAARHFRAVADRIFRFVEGSVDTALLRSIGLFAVGVGAMLVYVGVRAL